jgi:DNA-binding transcriptional regulator LsrR (DeoR family)
MTPPQVDPGRAELLADVAEMYYAHGKDQRTIAATIGTSRSNVSRLLAEARQRGIVDIRIHRPLGRAGAIERDLVSVFGIEEALVLSDAPQHSPAVALERVGSLAAVYLVDHLEDGLVVGLSWGTSLEAMVNSVVPARSYAVEVIQLLGGLSWVSPSLSGHELGRRLAASIGGSFSYLHAPAIVDSVEAHDSLIRQPGIVDVLSRARRADLAFVGIGSLGTGSSKALFSQAGLTASERKEIKSCNAVGDICARLFDSAGAPCVIELNRRIIGLGLEELRKIPHVVAIARGIEKSEGILGALRGSLVDVLITDEPTATAVLRLGE